MLEILQIIVVMYIFFFALKKREINVEVEEEIQLDEFCDWANAQFAEFMYEQDMKLLLSLVEGD